MAGNDLNTLELRDGDRRVMLKRGAVETVAAHPPAAPAVPAASAPALPPPAAKEDETLIPIKSPMPGTFYSAPKQGEKPFVSVGSEVDEQSDVCIVEAMKVFNNLKAECQGTIVRILAEDGQPVEFGTVLFLVKPK
jgi:acetyl-CoA carboxylase biotin carboxyl carrier protein